MNFKEIRQQYPQYNDLSDEEFARGFHKKFYSDMTFNSFADKVGYKESDGKRAARYVVSQMEKEGRTEPNFKDYAKIVGMAALSGIKDAGKSGMSWIGGRTLGLSDLAGDYLSDLTGVKDISPSKMNQDIIDEYGNLGRGINSTLGLLGGAQTMRQIGGKLDAKGLLGAGNTKLSKFAKAALIDTPSNAVSSSIGAGALTGILNPQTWYGNILTGVAGGVLGGAARKGIMAGKNAIDIKRGGDKLAKQLSQEMDFSPVSYGRLSDDKLAQINEIQKLRGSTSLSDGKVNIPDPSHLYNERVSGNGYDPQRVVDSLKNTIHGKDSSVVEARNNREAIMLPSSKTSDVTIVEPNTNFDGIDVITTGKRNNNGIKQSSLVERRTSTLPQNENALSASSAGSKGTSGLQGAKDIIQDYEYNVKQNNFIQALGDTDKSETMKSGVKAGDKNTREMAQKLVKDIEDMRSGKKNEALRSDLETPEMYKARDDYAAFDNKYGKQQVPQEQVDAFFENNPLAKNKLETIKRVNPQALKGKADNSFSALNRLKMSLHKDSKWNQASSDLRDAYRTAEQDLKTVLDNNFNGHRALDAQYAIAERVQEAFEDQVLKSAKDISKTKPTKWYSGAVIPALLGSFTPYKFPIAALSVAGNLGKRALQRNASRSIANGLQPITQRVGKGVVNLGSDALNYGKTPALSEIIFELGNTRKGE